MCGKDIQFSYSWIAYKQQCKCLHTIASIYINSITGFIASSSLYIQHNLKEMYLWEALTIFVFFSYSNIIFNDSLKSFYAISFYVYNFVNWMCFKWEKFCGVLAIYLNLLHIVYLFYIGNFAGIKFQLKNNINLLKNTVVNYIVIKLN